MDHETDEVGLAGAIARAGRIWAEALATPPREVAGRERPVRPLAATVPPEPPARSA